MSDYILFSLSELIESYSEDEISSKLETFSCDKEHDLESFLHDKAIVYEKSNLGRTFLFIDKNLLGKSEFCVMAFFTIAQTSYDISKLSKKRKRKVLGSSVPGRDDLNSFPAFLIGQLGRCDKYSAIQLPGHKILHECYIQLKEVHKGIGGEHIILECREHMFEKFYNNQGFKKMVTEPDEKGLLTLYNRVDFKKIAS